MRNEQEPFMVELAQGSKADNSELKASPTEM